MEIEKNCPTKMQLPQQIGREKLHKTMQESSTQMETREKCCAQTKAMDGRWVVYMDYPHNPHMQLVLLYFVYLWNSVGWLDYIILFILFIYEIQSKKTYLFQLKI